MIQNKHHRKATEIVENADLYKPVLNEIITTQEYCVKYDFVTPLTILTKNLNHRLLTGS